MNTILCLLVIPNITAYEPTKTMRRDVVVSIIGKGAFSSLGGRRENLLYIGMSCLKIATTKAPLVSIVINSKVIA